MNNEQNRRAEVEADTVGGFATAQDPELSHHPGSLSVRHSWATRVRLNAWLTSSSAITRRFFPNLPSRKPTLEAGILSGETADSEVRNTNWLPDMDTNYD
jgi:hypothetical protein